MDNPKEPIYSVSNPLDLLQDENYMRQACAAEEKFGGNVGAGLDWRPLMGKLLTNLPLRMAPFHSHITKYLHLQILANNDEHGRRSFALIATKLRLAPLQTIFRFLNTYL